MSPSTGSTSTISPAAGMNGGGHARGASRLRGHARQRRLRDLRGLRRLRATADRRPGGGGRGASPGRPAPGPRLRPRHRQAREDRPGRRGTLAEMDRALGPEPEPAPDPARRRLAALVARRDDLARTITREKQRLALTEDGFVRRTITALLRVLVRHRAALEAEIIARPRSPRTRPRRPDGAVAHSPRLGRRSPRC